MMTVAVSQRTMATLLLTAPLLPRPSKTTTQPLRPREYRELMSVLAHSKRCIEDLLDAHLDQILDDVRLRIEPERVSALLARGMQLANALDRWRERGIWVIGHGDPPYPQEITARLGSAAPLVLYGCGDPALLRVAGLAMVGSRNATSEALDFVRSVAEAAAGAGVPIVSGGAPGIDAAAMRAALRAGGSVVGVLAQRLDRAVVAGENRELLADGQLLLLSPYDPATGFNVGNAMARNKLIYAFARAALVASADHGRGGTWTGAVEQRELMPGMPLYVRPHAGDEALAALLRLGAKAWSASADIVALVNGGSGESAVERDAQTAPPPRESLLDHAGRLLECVDREYSRAELQEYLEITPGQLNAWLPKLLATGVIEQASKRPSRYRRKSPALPLLP